jgi:hypothetical protein
MIRTLPYQIVRIREWFVGVRSFSLGALVVFAPSKIRLDLKLKIIIRGLRVFTCSSSKCERSIRRNKENTCRESSRSAEATWVIAGTRGARGGY